MLTCRIGPTARNIFNRQKDGGDTHLHIGCWRFEPDLGDPVAHTGGPKDADVLIVRRLLDEQKEKFEQVAKPFNKNGFGQACEGSARWVPEATRAATEALEELAREGGGHPTWWWVAGRLSRW